MRLSTNAEQMAASAVIIAQSANTLSAQAVEASVNAENDAAEAATKAETNAGNIQTLQLQILDRINGGFVDEETGKGYFTADGRVIFELVGMGGGSGGGGGGGSDSGNNAHISMTNTSGWMSKTIAADGDTCPVSFHWTSLENDLPTGNGSLTVRVNGVLKATLEVQQGDVTVDVAGYVETGSNIVSLTVNDIYQNNRTINMTVTVVEISLSSSFDASTPYTGAIPFPYTPVGSVTKTVHFILDGTEIGTQTTSVSGRQQSFTIPQQPHGAHTFRVYFEAAINGQAVRSNELYYEMICIDPLSTVPIIVSPFNSATAVQYATLNIPFTVYDPMALTAAVTIEVNGTQVSAQTVDRTEHTFAWRAEDAGALTVTIKSGTATKTISVTVSESDIHVEAETQNLALHLNTVGRSNNEAHPETWADADNHISATLAGFNFKSDGWQLDENGVTVLRVAGDARVTIPYQIFATDFRTSGKTVEVEFATRDVTDYDAVILSCLSGGRGLNMTAQLATLTSEQSRIDMQYKEGEHVRIGFVVEKRSEHRLIFVYVNGIVSGVVQYPASDDFQQTTPVGISIGSNSCTVDLYRIRVYDNDLTRHQMLDNWIADSQNVDDLIERYNRNNVYDAYGNIVIANLPGSLPYMIIQCAELPQYKGDKKTCTVTYVDPVTPSKSFTAENVQIDVQGTSSQYYARKNYKMKYKGGFLLNNGTRASKYALRAASIPTNTFCMKADVASSEGANNVELAILYNDACPFKTPPQVENDAVRQGIDGFPCVIFWSDGTATTFLGKYNFNNDKGTEEVFGFEDGDESYLMQTRGTRNTAYTLVCPLDNVNDTEIYIYSASQLASVGDLSGLKVGFADFSMGTKLSAIKLGDSAASYDNANLKELYLGNNTLLRTLDVRGCSGLGTGDMKSVDIHGCVSIENVYFDGTAITGVELPNGGQLRVLHLPATITNLTIRNQTAITDLTVPSYANITTLWLENVSAAVDMLTILNAIPAASRVRLIGVAWEATTAAEILAIISKLDTMRGLDESGNNMDTAQVQGTIHISALTGAEMATILEAKEDYPYLDVIADHTSSTLTYKSYDGSSTLKTVSCIDGVPQESAPSGPSRASTAQYSYAFVGWNREMDAQTAQADAATNVMEDRTIYAAYSRTVRTYSITWKNADNTTLRTDTLAYGATPSWGQAMPTYNGQTAQGWTPTISTVTGNATYTASYIPTYTATFVRAAEDGGGTLYTQQNVQQGTTPTYGGETPTSTREGYTFNGWTPALSGIQANTTYTAVFRAPSDAPTATTADGAYGVEWDYSGSGTTLTRKGLAASFANPAPATDLTSSGSSPFDSIQPWAGMKRYNVVNGSLVPDTDPSFDESANDTVVYIPEFYYTAYKDTANSKWLWAISPTAKEGYKKHPGSGVYVGRFHTSGDSSAVFSKGGVAPLANVTRANFRTYSAGKGNDWRQMDLKVWSAIQLLYLVEFADWHSQDTLGGGQNSGSVKNTGATTGAAYHTVKRTGNSNAYRWIENPFSNVYTWVDGFVASSRNSYIATDPASYGDTTSGMEAAGIRLPSSNYITGLGYSEKCAWAFIPDTASGGSATTKIPDYVNSGSGTCVLSVGGDWGAGDSYGLFCFNAGNGASGASAYFGSRLLYQP